MMDITLSEQYFPALDLMLKDVPRESRLSVNIEESGMIKIVLSGIGLYMTGVRILPTGFRL